MATTSVFLRTVKQDLEKRLPCLAPRYGPSVDKFSMSRECLSVDTFDATNESTSWHVWPFSCLRRNILVLILGRCVKYSVSSTTVRKNVRMKLRSASLRSTMKSSGIYLRRMPRIRRCCIDVHTNIDDHVYLSLDTFIHRSIDRSIYLSIYITPFKCSVLCGWASGYLF
jgi:hypothetical protein